MMPSPQRVGEKAGWLHVADVGEIIDAVLCLLSLFLQVVSLLRRVVLMCGLLFFAVANDDINSKSAIIAKQPVLCLARIFEGMKGRTTGPIDLRTNDTMERPPPL